MACSGIELMAYDPKYKMRYRPEPISRLRKYNRFPPHMVDDPSGCWKDWDERCHAVYQAMMELKRGVIPQRLRRGLWFYSTDSLG